MNTNQASTNALVVKHYDNTYQICVTLGEYVRANAPDQKTRGKALRAVSSHSHMRPRDMLYALYAAFDALSERAYYKAAGRDKPEHDKHTARAGFYRNISQWALACYDLVKEAPVIAPDRPKDAEDDSDPYSTVLAALQERLTLADFGKRRVDTATALFKAVVLVRPVGATVLDILASFGDEASELSWGGEYEAARFWDACVKISDDLRGDLVADQLKKASTVTVMWEFTGDPQWALYRTRMAAERAARECFPDDSSSQRYSRLKFRTVKP